ncbi:MAG: glycoside hydrolase family 43 protein [Opitutaceae bacterium]
MKICPILFFFVATALNSPARADYLFTYFTKNGEDGLHLAASTDGYKWERLNEGKSYLAPKVGKSKLMRDPCVVRGPDGTFHMVWTSGWNENNIGYASSKDFIGWSEQKEIPVMAHEPTVRNSWAPEIVFDDRRREFLVFWASTIPGKFPETAGSSETEYNHRMYFTTTKDFATFAPTKLFYDPGFSVIDATFLKVNGKPYLIVKDETRTPAKKYLQLAEADDMHGPFKNLSAPFTSKDLWVEGPTAIKIGDDYVVYYDAYIKKHYGALRSRDLKTWEDVTAKLSFPDENTPVRMRHGTVIEVPKDIVTKLRAAK